MGRRPKVEREAVLRAARELFGERGFDGTTLTAIAARVGVSAAALLRHAPTKQALFEAAMAGSGQRIVVPLEFLTGVDARREDPRQVIRRIGEVFVPFLESVLGQTVALWMRTNTLAVEDPERMPLLFDRAQKPTPPQRALALVEGYLRRAKRARRLDVADPRAAAVGLIGALHAFVLLHRVAKAVEPPLPLARYLDTLVDVWVRGLGGRPKKEKR
jgi:AcrR family transcriptional regulator